MDKRITGNAFIFIIGLLVRTLVVNWNPWEATHDWRSKEWDDEMIATKHIEQYERRGTPEIPRLTLTDFYGITFRC